MNWVVRKHVPVGELPPDWQVDLPKDGHVSVEIEVEPPEMRRTISSLVGTARNVHGDEASVLDHLEGLREDR